MLSNRSIIIHFSIILIGVFMFHLSMNTLIYINFRINQKYISEEVCINKFAQTNTCKGSCYLKSQFKKNGPQKKSVQSYLKYKIDLYFKYYEFVEMIFRMFYQKQYSIYVHYNLNGFHIDVFHPPAQVV